MNACEIQSEEFTAEDNKNELGEHGELCKCRLNEMNGASIFRRQLLDWRLWSHLP